MSQINVNKIFDANGGATAVLNGVLTTPLGMRNKIINGKMDIAQRGTNFTGWTTGSAYTIDRWSFVGAGVSSAVTISQQTDVPTNNEFQSSLRLAVTTADTSLASGDVVSLNQVIEGYNVRDLIGNAFTLSFWVRSTKTGTHCVSFANSNGDRAYVTEYTVTAANTWEKKTITVAGGLPTAGTWNWLTGAGLRVRFSVGAGSLYQGAANAWGTSDVYATANQVNCLDTVGNIFAITGVQLEVGSAATPFEHRSVGQELVLCQRYYEKSYDVSIAPGSFIVAGAHHSAPMTGWLLSCQIVRFAVQKRSAPSVTLYNPNNGLTATGSMYDGGGTFQSNKAAGSTNIGTAGFEIAGGDGTLTTTTGYQLRTHWAANAEL